MQCAGLRPPPCFAAACARTAELLRRDEDFIDGAVRRFLAEHFDGESVDAAALAEFRERVPSLRGPFLPDPPAGRLRFAAPSAAAPRRGRPPGAKAAAPAAPREALRGFDLVAGNRGYARTRRAR